MADGACEGRTLARAWYLEATFREGTALTSATKERRMAAAQSMPLNAGCISATTTLVQYIFAGMNICTLIYHCNHDDAGKNRVF